MRHERPRPFLQRLARPVVEVAGVEVVVSADDYFAALAESLAREIGCPVQRPSFPMPVPQWAVRPLPSDRTDFSRDDDSSGV